MVDNHVKRGLFESLNIEKKKRKRGKRLNLLQEESKGAELWSPAKVRRAKELLAKKEAAIEQKKLNRQDTLAINAAKKEEERLQVALRKEERAMLAAEKRAEKAAKSAEVKAKRAVAKLLPKKPRVRTRVPLKSIPVSKAIDII